MLFFLTTAFVIGWLVVAPVSQSGRSILGFVINAFTAILVRVLIGTAFIACSFYFFVQTF
jgi:hypothetical protein